MPMRMTIVRSSHFILTRSASEGTTYRPRWRFGLVSLSAATSLELKVIPRAFCSVLLKRNRLVALPDTKSHP